MDSGRVYVFEYAWDEHVAAVAERVAFKLAAREELVDHDFLARHGVEGLFEHRDERLFVVDGAHRDASDDEARAHHERVAESVRGFERLFDRGDVDALRLGHAYAREQARELSAVLRRLYDLCAGAEELHAARGEVEAEAQRGLPAEAGEYARRLFAFEYRHRVVDGQRLEVERVGYVVVGADRLGVDVHHYRADAAAAQRLYGLDAAVVEFDALRDTYRAGAEDYDAALVRAVRVVASARRAVVVAGAGGELARAAVDLAVARGAALSLYYIAGLFLRQPGGAGYLRGGEALHRGARYVAVDGELRRRSSVIASRRRCVGRLTCSQSLRVSQERSFLSGRVLPRATERHALVSA